MFFVTMNTLLALVGMAAAMLATRWWPQNKRILLLAFNLCFIGVFSQKLLVFYAVYTLLNYAGFIFLSRTVSLRRFWFITAIAVNVASVSLLRFVDMGWFGQHPLLDPMMNGAGKLVILIGLIYNVLKVIDAYYFAYFIGKDAQVPLLDYANYILFVPTFTSGPILKFRDFMADTKQPYKVDAAQVEASVKRIILGLFKKIVLVVWVSDLYKHVLGGELHAPESLFLMLLFYAWVYFDFSGYSDIAVGFGRLMGYNIPENFKHPFLSPTLTQYWRNWHATLGDWFRDHIFMFFSRKTPSRWTAAGLSLLIMVLIGLWHGFTWLYVAWGVYHGVLLALENLLGQSLVNKRKVSKPYFYFRCLLTQAFVTLAVVVYSGGSEETVLRIYKGLFSF
jgi:alginate O-acetyltransferase complex protein AlgI